MANEVAEVKWRVLKQGTYWVAVAPNGREMYFQSWRAAVTLTHLSIRLGRLVGERLTRMAEAAERRENSVVDGEVRQIEGTV